MVKKNTIGKIQVGIGIIMIIGIIIGIPYALDVVDSIEDNTEDLMVIFQTLNEKYNESDFNDSDVMLDYLIEADSLSSRYERSILFKFSTFINSSLFAVIGFFLSLLFITQGLANMGDNKIK